jgi:hypothetical protein
MGVRVLRRVAAGVATQIFVIYLANAGKLPDSLFQRIFTPALFIASVLRIGAHDGGIVLLVLLEGTLVFGSVAFLLDLLIIRGRNSGTQI